MCPPPFLHPPKKTFLLPSVWPRREYNWTLNWKESLLICFENFQGVPYSQRQSRNKMMNTFIIVNINPTCKRWFMRIPESMLVHSKKAFLLYSVWPGTEYNWALIWKKSLLICFENYQGIYFLFLHRQSRQRMVNNLLMVIINPIWKR